MTQNHIQAGPATRVPGRRFAARAQLQTSTDFARPRPAVVAMFFALAPAVAKVVHTNYLNDIPAFDAELRATKGALTHKNSTELVRPQALSRPALC